MDTLGLIQKLTPYSNKAPFREVRIVDPTRPPEEWLEVVGVTLPDNQDVLVIQVIPRSWLEPKKQTFAQLAYPLFNGLHMAGIKANGFYNKWSAYAVSEAVFEQLRQAANSEGSGYSDPALEQYGFISLMYKGTPIISSADLEDEQVVPIDRDLVRALHSKLPAYDTIDTRPAEEAISGSKRIFDGIMRFTPSALYWDSELPSLNASSEDIETPRNETAPSPSDDAKGSEPLDVRQWFKQFETPDDL